MLDPRVRPRVHEGLVPVVVANEVRRSAVLAAGLDNDRRVLMHPDHFALEVDPVTYRCSHPCSILWTSPTECGREGGWPEDPDGMSVVALSRVNRGDFGEGAAFAPLVSFYSLIWGRWEPTGVAAVVDRDSQTRNYA
jgi:hypothetical protein